MQNIIITREIIEQELLREIGLFIDKKNHIIDQDTSIGMLYRNKPVISPLYCHPNFNGRLIHGQPFDITNYQFMRNVVNYYLEEKLCKQDGMYFPMSYVDTSNPGYQAFAVVDGNNVEYKSQYYNTNIPFQFIEIIGILSNNDILKSIKELRL